MIQLRCLTEKHWSEDGLSPLQAAEAVRAHIAAHKEKGDRMLALEIVCEPDVYNQWVDAVSPLYVVDQVRFTNGVVRLMVPTDQGAHPVQARFFDQEWQTKPVMPW